MKVDLRFMPCTEFEQSLHDFVDGELAELEAPAAKALVIHLELCDNCRNAVDALRKQIRVHQAAIDFEQIVGGFDKGAFFQSLTGKLMGGNLERMANLLYELGKAYFVAVNDSRLVSYVCKKAVSIERSLGEGKRLVKETLVLAETAGATDRKTRGSLRRSEQLFRRSARPERSSQRLGVRSGKAPLDTARRFLEECLMIEPAHPQARLYLGVYFYRLHRPDEAMAEYRKVLALPKLDKLMRVMALQALGSVQAYLGDYPRAIETYEEIRALGTVEDDPRFFTVLLSLAMFHAKTGHFERSKAVFGEMVGKFPQRLAEARSVLAQAEVFRDLLEARSAFRLDLLRRYPMLFAS